MHENASGNARHLLNLVRREAIQELGARAASSTQLGNAALTLVRLQGLDPTPRAMGFAVKEICQRAVARCTPDDNTVDTRRLRSYTLLRAFYLEKRPRRATLQLMHLAGNSAFDAVREHALSHFAQALEQICNELIGQPDGVGVDRDRAASSSTPDDAFVPESWLTAVVRKGRNIPARLYRVLYGRGGELEKLTAWLTEQNGARVICLTGIGGNGKTALAHEAAHRTLAFFTDVLWVSAKQRDWVDGRTYQRPENTLNFDRLMDGLISQTSLAGINLRGPQERQAALKELFAGNAYLIVLDNLEDSEDAVGISLRMLDLLGQSKLLITTRNRFIEDLPVARECCLNGLSISDTADYLRGEGEHQGVMRLEQASDAIIAEIQALTGGAPLALNLVIGQARSSPLAMVLDRLRKAVGSPRYFYQYLFTQDWEELDADARRVWVYLACATPADIARSHLKACHVVDDASFDLAIESLVRLQLIESDASPMASDARISLHPLARRFAQHVPSILEIEPALAEFQRGGCIALAAQNWIEIGREEPEILRQNAERTNALFAARASAEHHYDAHVVDLWRFMSQPLYETGFWHDHVQLSEMTLAAAGRVHDLPAEAEISGDLGWMLGELNRIAEAAPLVQSALALYLRLDDVVGQVRMRRYLATLTVMRGELTSARAQLEALRDAIFQALETADAEERTGLERQLVPVHGSLGAVCREVDDDACADGELTLALEKAHLFNKRSRPNALLNLGKLRFKQARLDDANALLNECLSLSIEGSFRDIAADALLELAKIARLRGDMATARRLAGDSSKVYHTIGASDRAHAAQSLMDE